MVRSNKLCFRAGLDYAPECAISHSRLRRLEAAADRVRRKGKASSSPRSSEAKQPARLSPSRNSPRPTSSTTAPTADACELELEQGSGSHAPGCESPVSLEGLRSGSFSQNCCHQKCCTDAKDGRPDTPDRDPETTSAVSNDSGCGASCGPSPVGSSANLQETGGQAFPEPLPSGHLASLVRLMLLVFYL